jgi:hypothetical protein
MLAVYCERMERFEVNGFRIGKIRHVICEMFPNGCKALAETCLN